VKARLKDTDSFFVIHIETQAQHQNDFPARLFGYFAKLHEKYSLPVYPIAVLSFDRPRHSQPSSYKVAFPDLKVLRFDYRTIQLNRMDWRQFLGRANPVAAALMAKMHIAPNDRPRVKLECLVLLTTLKLDSSKLRMISAFIDTYLQLTAAEMEEYELELRELEKSDQEAVMDYVTSWERAGIELGLQQGLQQGREEGRREGVQAGMAIMVMRQLTNRVGTLTDPIAERIGNLAPRHLEALNDAMDNFRTTEDVDRWFLEVLPSIEE
jgi:hypothetical protein